MASNEEINGQTRKTRANFNCTKETMCNDIQLQMMMSLKLIFDNIKKINRQ
jgi:hypothetical protein